MKTWERVTHFHGGELYTEVGNESRDHVQGMLRKKVNITALFKGLRVYEICTSKLGESRIPRQTFQTRVLSIQLFVTNSYH